MSTKTTTSRTPKKAAGRSTEIARPKARKAGWTDLDVRAVDTVRVLAADAVQKAGNGHPGTAMSLAPAAYLLFQNVMTHDPSDPTWLGRDRFVLSCGHSSLTQYIQLYLSGYGLELDDLKSLRTWGSLTPGHPEVHHTKGVEITTGPLGSGLASAVGMAMAQRRQRGLLDPDAKPGTSPFDHHVWVLASDGDLMEGVASEASSLAGHQELGNLTVVYDANQISIEDDTDISFSEDVAMRYEAYGWEVVDVDWRRSNDPAGTADYVEDVDALLAALEKSRSSRTKPTLVRLHTVIAWPAPNARGTGKSHGSALGDAEIAATKELLGFDPKKTFEVDKDALKRAREVQDPRQGRPQGVGQDVRRVAQGQRRARRPPRPPRRRRRSPTASRRPCPSSTPTPRASPRAPPRARCSAPWPPSSPSCGAAPPTSPSRTTRRWAASPRSSPRASRPHEWKGGPYGRTLHFGIRENAMGMILNGIALEGLTRPYGGTFLVFSDYMRPAVRLAAIQQVPVTFVWTHDSIGLGEDGPTHQPIEHLAALRAMPGLDVVRPADANETAAGVGRGPAPRAPRRPGPVPPAAAHRRPQGARQGRPASPRAPTSSSTPRTAGDPDVVLIATGSEVPLALEARLRLEKSGIGTRVVSMPCREWFEEQPRSYQNKVLPPSVRARVSVEAGVAMGWHDLVGDSGRCISIEHFGASADAATLFREFGFTPEAVVKAAKDSLAAARKAGQVPSVNETAPRARKDTGTDVRTTKAPSRKSAASAGK